MGLFHNRRFDCKGSPSVSWCIERNINRQEERELPHIVMSLPLTFIRYTISDLHHVHWGTKNISDIVNTSSHKANQGPWPVRQSLPQSPWRLGLGVILKVTIPVTNTSTLNVIPIPIEYFIWFLLFPTSFDTWSIQLQVCSTAILVLVANQSNRSHSTSLPHTLYCWNCCSSGPITRQFKSKKACGDWLQAKQEK